MGFFGDDGDSGEFVEDLLITGNVGSAMELQGLQDGDMTEVVEGALLSGNQRGRGGFGLGGFGGILAAEALFGDDDRRDEQYDQDNQDGGSSGGW